MERYSFFLLFLVGLGIWEGKGENGKFLPFMLHVFSLCCIQCNGHWIMMENLVLSFFRGLVNDTYKMDLILIHPPHLIALACIYIASVQKDKENTAWFEELRVDMNVVSHLGYIFWPGKLHENTSSQVNVSINIERHLHKFESSSWVTSKEIFLQMKRVHLLDKA